ncbi:MAG TPA: T9SS type A sorting domain-containing protein [Bacteroidia bacterium]
MKKSLFILGTAFCLNAQAQLINPGFETWSADMAVPSANEPNSGNNTTGWWTYNMFNSSFVGSSPISVFRCDTFHGGALSARIETVVYTSTSYGYTGPWGVPFIGHNYLDTLGILFTGTTNESGPSFKPGIPCTQKLATLSFWYQYKPNGVDTAECRVLLVNQRNPVAGGLVKINTATTGQWVQSTVSFTYVSALTPDTLYVLFSSSSLDKKPKAGSIFWVDDVSTTLVTGIEQFATNNEQVVVYPNPAKGIINIESKMQNGNSTLQITDMLGNTVKQAVISNLKSMIDISDLNEGVYNLSLISNEGVVNKRVVITR